MVVKIEEQQAIVTSCVYAIVESMERREKINHEP
jgi:hypothetical protein